MAWNCKWRAHLHLEKLAFLPDAVTLWHFNFIARPHLIYSWMALSHAHIFEWHSEGRNAAALTTNTQTRFELLNMCSHMGHRPGILTYIFGTFNMVAYINFKLFSQCHFVPHLTFHLFQCQKNFLFMSGENF